jgi:hypothetical protein
LSCGGQTKRRLPTLPGLLPQDEINHLTWENLLHFRAWSRICEYTHSHPELVSEVVMEDNSKDEPIGWIVFGAERIPSLHQ